MFPEYVLDGYEVYTVDADLPVVWNGRSASIAVMSLEPTLALRVEVSNNLKS